MMRDLKFRACFNGKWQYFTLEDLVSGATQTSEYTDELPTQWCQYTGLHDANGRDIYEGDILKKQMGVCWSKGIEKKEFHIGEVAWIDGCHGYRVGDLGLWANDLLRGAEVIGNIYETPELLK